MRIGTVLSLCPFSLSCVSVGASQTQTQTEGARGLREPIRVDRLCFVLELNESPPFGPLRAPRSLYTNRDPQLGDFLTLT